MYKNIQKLDGRLITISILLVFSLVFLATTYNKDMAFAFKYMLNIPPMQPIFADLHVIRGAYESMAHGLDPYIKNPYDPWNRMINYPPIWIYILGSWLTPDNTTLVGIIVTALFYSITFIFIGRLSFKQGLYYGLILSSHVVFLVLERGNIDILIFLLLVLCIFSYSRINKYRDVLPWGFVYLGSILKFYPIFAMFALINKKDKWFKPLIITGVLFIIYLIYIFHYVELIAENTPRAMIRSYGSAIMPGIFYDLLSSINVVNHNLSYQHLLVIGGLCMIILLSIIYYTTRTKTAGRFEQLTPKLIAFRFGSLIYIGSFALGSNWDYRLIFLILTLPQLFEWRSNKLFDKTFINTVLVAIFLVCDWMFISTEGTPRTLLLNESVCWYLLGCYGYLYLQSLPDWARQLIHYK